MAAPDHAFVTGGTGLIGRAVIERLLRRGIHVTALVRTPRDRREAILDSLHSVAGGVHGTLTEVSGDLRAPALGLDDAGLGALGRAGHCFHLAALYDIDAADEDIEAVNVGGTKQLLVALEGAKFAGRLHHVSSIAVVGDYDGTFTEAMFDHGQALPHAYHRSKYESERLVRESGFDYRVYRPSSVVGDSKTGVIDKVDGVYFGFGAIKKLAYGLPGWLRLPIPRVRGGFNVVPVDYVADALTHIGLSETDAKVFHLVDPKPPSLSRMTDIFVSAAGGPRLGPAVDFGKMPGIKKTGAFVSMLPSARELRDAFLKDLGLPVNGLGLMNVKARYDDQNTQAVLEGSGIACPPLRSYAKTLYRYYEDHLDPMTHRQGRYRKALAGKVVLVTGSSRGIGLAVAQMAAEAGAKVLLVARDAELLEGAADEIRASGGKACAHVADLSSLEQVDALAQTVLSEHGGVDVLIHNAARSIRRPIVASLDRFHDYERTMALNYFAPVRLTLRLLPSLCERSGTVSHVLTMGVLIPGPYFAAYLATKSALDAFGDSLMAELQHEGLHVSSVYLPLVKTDMMAPVEEYSGRRDVMTPKRAATMILDGVVDRRRRVVTPAGAVFAFTNRVMPATTSRILNLIERTFPVGDAPSEFPIEKALITNAIGGSPI
jgi:short-subunit dehydrogenase